VLISGDAQALRRGMGKVYELRAEDVEKAIGESIEKSGVAKHPRAVITNNRTPILHKADHVIAVEINDLEVDSAKETWVANMILLNGNNVVSARPLTGRYEEQQAVPVLKHRITKGQVIDAEDIEQEYVSEYKLQANTITNADELIGMMPSRTIAPHRPVRSNEIMKPMIMSKGAIVQMLYQSPTMDIRTMGEVLDEGSVGDMVRVRNLDSRQVVHGKIMSSKEVAVGVLP
jgi:flagella basal body P-ring formation protein FlgA